MYLKTSMWLALFGLLLLPLTACSTGGQRPSTKNFRGTSSKDFNNQPSSPLIPADYTLGSGDELTITFMNMPGTSSKRYTLQSGDTLLVEFHGNDLPNRNLTVGPDGYVVIPYIGEIKAADKTLSTLHYEIVQKYNEGGFLNDASITISLIHFNSGYKEIQKLNTDGGNGYGRTLKVEMNGRIRLPLAGSILAAGKNIDEVEQIIQTVYSSFFPCASIFVDIKEVRSNLVYILGYVNRPGMLNMTSPTTVTQAISQAGGFQETAGLDSVIIVRRTPGGKPLYNLFDLNAALTRGDMSSDVLLRRYDVVYVPPSSIHELNKTVQYGIRNMLPLQSSINVGFSYLFGPATNDN